MVKKKKKEPDGIIDFFIYFLWTWLVVRRRAYCITILAVNQTPTGNWPYPPGPVTGKSKGFSPLTAK